MSFPWLIPSKLKRLLNNQQHPNTTWSAYFVSIVDFLGFQSKIRFFINFIPVYQHWRKAVSQVILWHVSKVRHRPRSCRQTPPIRTYSICDKERKFLDIGLRSCQSCGGSHLYLAQKQEFPCRTTTLHFPRNCPNTCLVYA